MSAPQKPWEVGAPTNNMLNRNVPGMATNSFIGGISPQDQLLGGGLGLSGGGLSGRAGPPLPPRPQQQQSVNSYSRYGGGYSTFGSGYSNMYSSSPYSSYCSPYSGSFGGGYGGYGGGYNRLGYYGSDGYQQGGPDDGTFMQMAEDSSRPAFQSIESIVHAVGSVSMMLESTFHAVYSSFRAVIGVADHFSRMKTHLGQIFSMLALLRALRWLFRRALYLLGLNKEDPRSEGAWTAASDSGPQSSAFLSENDIKQNKFNWPILLYLGMVFGTPWLIWKLLASVSQSTEKAPSDWASGKVDHFVATAGFDFTTDSDQEIPFRAGQEIILAPKELQPRVRGWLLGSIDGKKTGLVPANYIQIHGKRKGFVHPPLTAVTSETERLESSFAQAVPSSNIVEEQRTSI